MFARRLLKISEWESILARLDRRKLLLLSFSAGFLIMLAHLPFTQPERGDPAIWDYISQSILKGQVPIRDVVEIKTPLSAYISAVAMAIVKPFGIRDIYAVRILNILMVGLLSLITYMLGEEIGLSRIAGFIAVLLPLMPDRFAEWIISGTQPKLPMILFGMLTMLFLFREKWLCAGLFSTLSFLCWQPGLLFTGVAFLAATRLLTLWKSRAWIKVIAGALIPVTLYSLYLLSISSFGAVWNWTFRFAYSVYATHELKSLSGALYHFGKIVNRVFDTEIVLIILSLLGLIIFIVQKIVILIRNRHQAEFKNTALIALALPPLIYAGFCMINFQSGPDLIPLFPFMSLFCAWILIEIGRLLSKSEKSWLKESGKFWKARDIIILLIIMSGMTCYRVAHYFREPRYTLKGQRTTLQVLEILAPVNEDVYVHGAVEILVLQHRTNINPYIFLDWGKDDYIGSYTPGGFDAVLEQIKNRNPKMIVLDRMEKVNHKAELKQLVATGYQMPNISGYAGVYIRRDN